MKKKRIILTVVGVLVVVIIGGIVAFFPWAMRDVAPQGVDMAAVTDGSHIGIFEQGRFSNTLVVHVKNGMIVGIDIERDVFGAGITNASDEVFRRVLIAQDTRIDAVSGSTVTTNAYLMAIEDALRN